MTRSTSAITDPTTKRLLVVDDEEPVRTALAKFLRSKGFEVNTADGGAAALEFIARSRYHLVISDVRMPGMSGLELVPKLLATDPDLAIMMLSGVNDAPTATEALAHGAMDYLMKPVELPALETAVERALHKRELGIEQRRVEQLIRQEVVQRTAELERERGILRALTVRIAETLINAMEAKDQYLRGHSQRVADLGASIAEQLGLEPDVVEQVRLAGRLHDVGKIGVRESVLNKPGPLTPDEFKHVSDHVRMGLEILAPLAHLGPVLEFIRDHHERFDGTGYPHRRAGEAITLGGRILGAADAFDALTSRRAYREPLTPDATIDYLTQLAGTHLDPRVAEALRTIVTRRKSLVFIDDL